MNIVINGQQTLINIVLTIMNPILFMAIGTLINIHTYNLKFTIAAIQQEIYKIKNAKQNKI